MFFLILLSQVKLDTRTKTIFPRRGILAEFWPLGCATPREPGDGYLQFRNDSHATYSCSIGHLFLPALERTKTVLCAGRAWSQAVGNCYSIEFLRWVFLKEQRKLKNLEANAGEILIAVAQTWLLLSLTTRVLGVKHTYEYWASNTRSYIMGGMPNS